MISSYFRSKSKILLDNVFLICHVSFTMTKMASIKIIKLSIMNLSTDPLYIKGEALQHFLATYHHHDHS